MNLQKATLLAIIGICFTFALRTIGTLKPELFADLLTAQIVGTTLFLAGLTSVIFFAYFLKDYVGRGETALKKGSILAIIGSSLMSLLLLKSLLPILGEYTFRNLAGSFFIEPIIPWANSILILIFFVIFYKEAFRIGSPLLRKATLLAMVGSLVGFLLQILALSSYIYSGSVRWLSDSPRLIPILLLPLSAFSFLAILYFFSSFYGEKKSSI
jgi:formate-dependent nitrite reductase membrane component NrfD